MSRRNVVLALAALISVGLIAGLIVRVFFSGPPPNRLILAGDVRSVVRTVRAPALAYPTVNYTVTVVSNAAMGKKTQTLSSGIIAGPQLSAVTSASAISSATASLPTVSGVLTAVNVQVGDHVTTGTVLAKIDTQSLNLGVSWSKLAAEKTRNQVKVLNKGIQTILDNQDKIATGFSTLATGKAKLATGKTQLAAAKAVLVKTKAALSATLKQALYAKKHKSAIIAQLAADKAKAATYPPGKIPGSLLNDIKTNEISLGMIAAIPTMQAGLAKINAGFVQLATAQAALQTGAAALSTAAGQLDTASDALKTAKKQVTNARNVTRVIANGADLQISIAEAKRAQATLTSPFSGVVTQAPETGQVAIVGAPLVRIRPDAAALIDTYVTPDQLAQVRLGEPADISFDSGGGKTVPATVAIIGNNAAYPPTSFPTSVVHMTRTVMVTLRLDSGDAPPAGTPVDIAIHTN